MCDPVTLAGIGLSVAGGIGSAQTQQNYVEAVNRENNKAYEMSSQAREAERLRQKAMEDEGTAAFDRTAEGLTADQFAADKAAAAADFTSTLDAQPTVISAETRLPGQDGASVEVKNAIASRVNSEAAATRDRIKAFSDLNAYGSTGFDRGLSMGETGDFLSTLGGLRRGSLGVAQQEQEIRPASVTPGSNTFADILSGVGGIMAMGGPSLFQGGLFPAANMTYGTPLRFSPGVMPPIG